MKVVRCSTCGMGVVEQPPRDLASLYTDDYYASANESEYGYSDYYYTAEHGVAWAASLINLLAPHGRVLDVGCADGHLLRKIQSSCECYGIEVNSKMAASCTSAGIEIISSNIYDSALVRYEGFFDVVSAIAVLEHVADLKRAVEIALKLLAPTGILLFEVPLMSFRYPSDIWLRSSLEHIYYPSEDSLKYLFEKVVNRLLIGGEVNIEDYGSTFIGMVANEERRAQSLLEQYHRLFHGPISELRGPNERRFRFLLDCVHAARTTPEHLDLLNDFQPVELNSALLHRLIYLWRRDGERRDKFIAQLREYEARKEEREILLIAKEDRIRKQAVELDQLLESNERLLTTIATQEKELTVFRASKLQRLRSAMLHEEFSVRKIMKIVYLLLALGTPEALRQKVRPAVQKWKERFGNLPHLVRRRSEMIKAQVIRTTNEEWPPDKPLISVVIPCFNYGRYVQEAVDSVLSQTFQNIEIIVVDGGSTDPETLRVMRSFQKPKVRVYFREGRHLVGDNRNFGVQRANGKYICCLDADDKLKSTYLEKAAFILEAYGHNLVSTALRCFDRSECEWIPAMKPTLEQIIQANQFSTVAVFTKELWAQAGGYHDWGLGKDHVSEDWDLWVRMMALGARAINILEPLMLYRVHGEVSLSNDKETPSYDKQSEAIRLFNAKYLSRNNYRRSMRNNRAIFEVANPFVNLSHSSDRFLKRPALLLALPFMITGGADTVFLEMAGDLVASGFDLSIVTTIATDTNFGDNTEKYEAITKQVYHLYRFLEDRNRWKDFLFYLIESRQIEILLLAGSVYVYELLPEFKKRFPKLKVVDHLFNEFGHMANNRKYADCIDAHIVVNSVIKDVLINRFGEDETKIHVIVHGIDVHKRFNPDAFKALAPVDALPSDKFIVSFIGRFSEEKCPERFVDIVNLLRDEEGLQFLMLGHGPQYMQVRRKIASLGLEDKIALPGNVGDVRPYLRRTNALVIPSDIEGIPLTLIEALSAGVPVIASEVGGVSSVIRDGANGFVCKPPEIGAFASKIKMLANDAALRARVCANAREYAVQHLSAERMNEQYRALFQQLVATKDSESGDHTCTNRNNGTADPLLEATVPANADTDSMISSTERRST